MAIHNSDRYANKSFIQSGYGEISFKYSASQDIRLANKEFKSA